MISVLGSQKLWPDQKQNYLAIFRRNSHLYHNPPPEKLKYLNPSHQVRMERSDMPFSTSKLREKLYQATGRERLVSMDEMVNAYPPENTDLRAKKGNPPILLVDPQPTKRQERRSNRQRAWDFLLSMIGAGLRPSD